MEPIDRLANSGRSFCSSHTIQHQLENIVAANYFINVQMHRFYIVLP